MKTVLWNVLLVGLAAGSAVRFASAQPSYDPLAPLAPTGSVQLADLTVRDASRQRDLPLRVYLPTNVAAAPVVLFSHGLGGSCRGSAYLGEHWARRGYVAVFVQHPGSDESVWQGQPPARRMEALRGAADKDSFLARVKDVPAVLDQLATWNALGGHRLRGRLDLGRVGLSGHSFGAVTTQAVSGQQFGRGAPFTDRRIRAAIAFSPSPPRVGKPAQAFGRVTIPWMLMTGTQDDAVIGGTDAAARQEVFPALPPGGKYEVVLFDAEHSAFTERALPGDRRSRNPNHHRAILALSTAFWDAWLTGNAAAREWLDGTGPAAVLEPADRWQRK